MLLPSHQYNGCWCPTNPGLLSMVVLFNGSNSTLLFSNPLNIAFTHAWSAVKA